MFYRRRQNKRHKRAGRLGKAAVNKERVTRNNRCRRHAPYAPAPSPARKWRAVRNIEYARHANRVVQTTRRSNACLQNRQTAAAYNATATAYANAAWCQPNGVQQRRHPHVVQTASNGRTAARQNGIVRTMKRNEQATAKYAATTQQPQPEEGGGQGRRWSVGGTGLAGGGEGRRRRNGMAGRAG